MLETYAKKDVISETDAKIIRFTQPPNQNSIKYAELLWVKSFRYDRVFDENVPRGKFMEGIQDSTCQSLRSFSVSNKHAHV